MGNTASDSKSDTKADGEDDVVPNDNVDASMADGSSETLADGEGDATTDVEGVPIHDGGEAVTEDAINEREDMKIAEGKEITKLADNTKCDDKVDTKVPDGEADTKTADTKTADKKMTKGDTKGGGGIRVLKENDISDLHYVMENGGECAKENAKESIKSDAKECAKADNKEESVIDVNEGFTKATAAGNEATMFTTTEESKGPRSKRSSCCWCIDIKMLPSKLAYFVFYAGMGQYVWFVNSFLTSIGLSTNQAGLITGLCFASSALVGPLWGVLSDYTGRRKVIFAVVALCAAFSYFNLPWVAREVTFRSEVGIVGGNHTLNQSFIITQFVPTGFHTPFVAGDWSNQDASMNDLRGKNMQFSHSDWLYMTSKGTNTLFWVMLASLLIVNLFLNPLAGLLDSMVMDVIRTNNDEQSYGTQRLFGSLGGGIVPLIGGVLTDAYGKYYHDDNQSKYTAIFYLYLPFMLLVLPIGLYLLKQSADTAKAVSEIPLAASDAPSACVNQSYDIFDEGGAQMEETSLTDELNDDSPPPYNEMGVDTGEGPVKEEHPVKEKEGEEEEEEELKPVNFQRQSSTISINRQMSLFIRYLDPEPIPEENTWSTDTIEGNLQTDPTTNDIKEKEETSEGNTPTNEKEETQENKLMKYETLEDISSDGKVKNPDEQVEQKSSEEQVDGKSSNEKNAKATTPRMRKSKLFLSVIKDPDNVIFLISVLIGGFLLTTSQYFLTLLMTDEMKATNTQQGVAIISHCVAEVLMFPFAKKLIRLMGGPIPCMQVGLLCYFVRHLSLSFITNPWVVIAPQLLNSITFAFFIEAVMQYTRRIAHARIHTIMFTTIYTLHFSLPGLLANVCGGIVYHRYQGRVLYRATACLALTWCLFMFVYYHVVKRIVTKKANKRRFSFTPRLSFLV